jgi:hypothetical protein
VNDVEERIRAAIATAKAAENEGEWITYLIRDPRRPDKKGNAAGWPVYVGQTDEFGKRVRNHLRKSEKLARKGKGIKNRLKEVLHAGVVPCFEVLDRQPSRLSSLLSETNLARLCRQRGYDIANATTLQNRAGPAVTKYDLPKKWLLKFTLEQAVQDELSLEVVCTGCRTTAPIDVALLRSLPEPPKTVGEFRDWARRMDEPCDVCGKSGAKTVRIEIKRA